MVLFALEGCRRWPKHRTAIMQLGVQEDAGFMSVVLCLDIHTCPRCGLALKIVRDPAGGLAVRYDMAAWAQQCARKDADGPLGCASLRPSIKTWLGVPAEADTYDTTSGSA
jgi:hypothetical protein